jgi:hypothetical protein
VGKLRRFFEKLNAQGIEMALARAYLPLCEIELGSDLDHLLPDEGCFSQVSEAVAAFESHRNQGGKG